ncbi:hypothetical protein [Saccharothrix sp. ST-888]|uniref:hypothetical protein n=1 Tax=Saccharothrix sp. ST-888 TaxID=1427391 RepID=UPI0005ECC919|nr:hypothetical protein [Saccharothrix sp. ST-888]KJK56232.1 hypothetical protein UK12_23910 [Saccharothrix sp. ST-888]
MATIRILICQDCQTTETLPPYEGDPRNDTALEYATSKHAYPNGDRHFGRLYGPVEAGVWDNREAREEILKQLWQREGHTGMEPWVYQAVDTLKADAMQCWRSRQRPETCSDFHSSKKLLVPPTARDRKSEGLAKWDRANPGAQRYLCDYCPIRSVAEQQVRRQQGLYK